MISTIIKRDGRQVPFDQEKIQQAIAKAFAASGSQKGMETAGEMARLVQETLASSEAVSSSPTVEQVQDVVERVLIEKGFVYILFRADVIGKSSFCADALCFGTFGLDWGVVYAI